MKPKVLVLTGVGINSDRELAEAFDWAGASSTRMHVSDLEDAPHALKDYQLIALPGGFSYGDHISSGKILANLLKIQLGNILKEQVQKGTPIIGICNGFQILVKMGLLPDLSGEYRQEVSLIHNDSGRYEDRWVDLLVDEKASSKSPWFKNLKGFRCPVRHGEGKLVTLDKETLERMKAKGHVVLRYAKAGFATEEYPENPNGSSDAIAGLIDSSGLVLGLMPHPEVAIYGHQDPLWTRSKTCPEFTSALNLFKNIVEHLKKS